jgi:putative FmdB family regulatory protein
MPTYQYACTDADCGNRFELVQSFTDPAASECPVCAGPVRKVYGSVGVVFKGSGFYRTDSRNQKSDAVSASSSSGESSSSGSSDSAKSSSGGSAGSSSGSGTSSSNSTGSAGGKVAASA